MFQNIKKSLLLIIVLIISSCGGGSSSNSRPNAENVIAVDTNGGRVEMGDAIIGSYSYQDNDNDIEGVSSYRWLRNNQEISGATSRTYIIVAADASTQITFEVTPDARSGIETGNTVTSSAINVEAVPNPLNDTGIVKCADYAYTDSGTNYDVSGSGIHNNDLDCAVQTTVPTQDSDGYDSSGDVIRAGQDALYGRDVTHNDNSDGHAGFSFTKLDNEGNALADQTQNYATNPWFCVKDNITGLIWEVKTTNGLQNNTYTYTWYNSSNNNFGGSHGIGDTGIGTTTGYENLSTLYSGSDNCGNSSRCDTEKYVMDVNASNNGAGICGATDWRLPNKYELRSILNYNGYPAVNINYFPYLSDSIIWTSSPHALASSGAWGISTYSGGDTNYDKANTLYIRLVRNN